MKRVHARSSQFDALPSFGCTILVFRDPNQKVGQFLACASESTFPIVMLRKKFFWNVYRIAW
eukprot:5178771-Amphidinium_carterae.1